MNISSILQAAKLKLRELSLHQFFKDSWHVLEGTTEFIDSWHLKAISEHLEACYYRKIKKLLINVPPRTSKTSLISIAFPAWVWLQNPEERFMYASYAASLSFEHGLKCRRLIESDWYQNQWSDRCRLSKDRYSLSCFDNDRGGTRIATSVNAVATGKGANFLICVPYDTLIATNKGDLQIGDIIENNINCKIISFNHQQDCIELQQIKEKFKSEQQQIYELELENGIKLEITGNHPVYVKTKGYVNVEDLSLDDVVYFINNVRYY